MRLRKQVINESSYVGGIFTSRMGSDGTYNLAYGMDGIFKVSDNDYLNIKWAQVLDKTLSNKVFSLDPTRLYFNWSRFNQKGLNYNFTWSRSGKDFNPGIGFQMRSDYTHYFGGVGYGWIPGEAYTLQNHQVGLMAIVFTDNRNNSVQSFETDLTYDFRFKSDYSGMISLKHIYENVTDTFSFSRDADVPSGKYGFNQFETHLNSPQTSKFFLGLDIFAGSFYDGNRLTLGTDIGWNIGSTLQLGLRYEHNFLHFKDRDQSFSGGVAGIKALLMLTTKLSMSTFIQYNSAENTVITNFRLRYNPREGNDLYLVFNEGRNTFRDIDSPRLPLFNNRSVLIKYTYTFTL
jgi:hypothetical protein